jgi:hypothetical protein
MEVGIFLEEMVRDGLFGRDSRTRPELYRRHDSRDAWVMDQPCFRQAKKNPG